MAPKPGVASPKSSRRPHGWRRLAFPALSVLLVFAGVGLLELTLRAFDIANPKSIQDPLSGFSKLHPLFELDSKNGTYKTAASRRIFFGTQEFSAKKPAGRFRTFCLGGSTVRGRPYTTESSFVKWLELELAGRDSSRSHEVVNCGGLSYASYRLVPILEEVLQYSPDVIVVSTGHNEFLEDRTYQAIKSRSAARAWLEDRLYSSRVVTLARELVGTKPSESEDGKSTKKLGNEVEARLDESTGYATYHRDEEWQSQVIEHYDRSLRKMVKMCGDADVPLIFVQMGTNLRDCPPFKSEHRKDITPEDELRFSRLLDDASFVEAADQETALQMYLEAAEIDDRYALLNFRIARCMDGLGRAAEAESYYIKARDEDICPLRMVTRMHERLREVATSTDTPLVDAHQAIVKMSLDGIPGFGEFVDHVHPTIGVHQRMAQALAETVVELELVPDDDGWLQRRRTAYREHMQSLEAAYFANGARRVSWLENWARRFRLLEEIVPVDARSHLSYGHRKLDFGQTAEALDLYKQAVHLQAEIARHLIPRSVQLFEQGRAEHARELLQFLSTHTKDASLQNEAQLGLLVVAVELGDTPAIQELDILAKMAADPPVASSHWLAIMPDVVDRAATLLNPGPRPADAPDS